MLKSAEDAGQQKNEDFYEEQSAIKQGTDELSQNKQSWIIQGMNEY